MRSNTRLQFALGILEQQMDPAKHQHWADLHEEVQHMSGLVNELLSFSKASMQGPRNKMVRVNLAEVVDRVLAREKGQTQVEVQVGRELEVQAEPECVLRALSNVLRNALRMQVTRAPSRFAVPRGINTYKSR